MTARTLKTPQENNEPTLSEFYNFVKEQFGRMQERFERTQRQLVLLTEGLAETNVELGHLTRRVGRVEEKLEEVQDEVLIISTGLDESLEKLVNHEGRIKRLERKMAV